jgi:hypothetical protein
MARQRRPCLEAQTTLAEEISLECRHAGWDILGLEHRVGLKAERRFNRTDPVGCPGAMAHPSRFELGLLD